MSAVTEDMLRTYAHSDGLGLAALVRKGEVAPIELVETAVVAIEKTNPQLNAVISKLYDMGRAAAKDVDLNAPFAGVPYLLKELRTKWKDAPVTGSSSYLRNVRADSDTEVVKRIKAAGFLLVGKSNAPENGWSLSTEPTLYGATFNPWRQGVTPGGSSGGAAAAVASRMVPVAEATDAAGSIRSPRVLLRSRWAEADARPADSQSGWRCLAWLRFCLLQYENHPGHRRLSRRGRRVPSGRSVYSAQAR